MIPEQHIRRKNLWTSLVVAATCLAATPTAAHEGDHWPIAGNALKMSNTANGSDTRFSFKSRGQVNINPTSLVKDPTVERSTLIVRGSGAEPGTTGLIELDPERWAPIGSEASPKGWKFKGSPFYTDGITKILIKSGSKDGSLQIKAKSYYWPLRIPGPQDSVQIVLAIGDFAFCAEFSADRMAEFKTNAAGEVVASLSLAPGDCPNVCGNGIVESGEECDDGNFFDTDTCTNACLGCNPADADFASTYEGIQELIFDNPVYNCTNDACHGSSAQNGLDLRTGASYADLVGVASEIQPATKRVFPGDQDLSMLYMKIADKTLGTSTAPGTSMPQGPAVVTEDHLEAIRLWIRGGAPETGVVAGTAELLGSCLPAPTPLDIPQPPVPDPSLGTQFAMPGFNLLSGTEVEGCIASYYDVSATVPASAMVDCPGAYPGTNETGLNAGKCFSYNGNELYQDAQSHHSIIHIYRGDYDWNDPGWGIWRCYGGPTPNAACTPTDSGACGAEGVCGSIFHPGVACLPTFGSPWGAPDFSTFGNKAPQFSGSQESTANFNFPDGVYNLLPVKGLIVWNSHAFNLTSQDTQMEAWLNMTYTDQRTWPAQGLFANDYIFTQQVPPFERREYCATHTFANNTNLFQLTSHTHKRGIRWRYYAPPQTPCPVTGTGFASPACVASGSLFQNYESYDYGDPVVLNMDPPVVFAGTTAERTIKFCSLYDNGFGDPSDVKTQSGSPEPTGGIPFGGPCADQYTYCNGGVNMGELCQGNDANCPGSVCDACMLEGGVTTEDEMFIAIGTFYVP